MVVAEKNEGVGQVAVYEVRTAAEGVMDRRPKRVAADIHETRNVQHRDTGVVDPFVWVFE